MDKLDIIFELQASLDERIYNECLSRGIPIPTATDKARAMIHECCELQGEVGWKWWKDSKPNIPAAQEELVDVLHFLVSAAMDLQMTS